MDDTALHYAAYNGQIEIIKLITLLKSVTLIQTPLAGLAENHYTFLLKVVNYMHLLKHLVSSFNSCPEQIDDHQVTPLHCAASYVWTN